jgi:S1-C subfamily serine protease
MHEESERGIAMVHIVKEKCAWPLKNLYACGPKCPPSGGLYSSGKSLRQVAPHSAAARAGLHPEMLIRQVNQQPIENIEAFQHALAASDKRVLLLVQDHQSTQFVVLPLG